MSNLEELRLLDSDLVNPERNKLDLLDASFFRGDDGRDFCQIINMRDQGKNSVIQPVDPTHVRRWPDLWKRYQHGRASRPVEGTPLREVPGMDQAMIMVYTLRGIRTAEELAAASDYDLDEPGMGGTVMRDNAKLLLDAKRFRMQVQTAQAMAEGAQAAVLQTAPQAVLQVQQPEPVLQAPGNPLEDIIAQDNRAPNPPPKPLDTASADVNDMLDDIIAEAAMAPPVPPNVRVDMTASTYRAPSQDPRLPR